MDPSRISACTFPVRKRDLDFIFGLIRDSGFAKVDLWGGPPNFSADPDECDPVALREKAADYGLQIANLGTYPGRNFLAEDPSERQQEMADMKRTIDMAALLGCRSIRVHPGTGDDPSIISRLVPLFKESAEYAAEKNVLLGIENHKGSITSDPELCATLVAKVASPYFGVLYEPANLMHCGVDYREALELMRGQVVHVHVKDSRWVDGSYERTMLGRGDIDLAWVVDALERDGYRGDYALEYEIQDRIPVETGLPQWFEWFSRL